MGDTAAMAVTDTARGPLTPMPTMAATDMEAMAATDTARGPLTPMPTMAATDMEAMAATDTARGPLTLTMAATAMAVMAVTATASNFRNTNDLKPQKISIPDLNLFTNCYHDLNHLEIQYSVEEL